MKDEEYKDLDNFFKNRLEQINPDFEEEAWEALEKKLNPPQEGKHNRVLTIYRLHLRNLAAVVGFFMVLCGISFYYLMPTTPSVSGIQNTHFQTKPLISQSPKQSNSNTAHSTVKKSNETNALLPDNQNEKSLQKADNYQESVISPRLHYTLQNQNYSLLNKVNTYLKNSNETVLLSDSSQEMTVSERMSKNEKRLQNNSTITNSQQLASWAALERKNLPDIYLTPQFEDNFALVTFPVLEDSINSSNTNQSLFLISMLIAPELNKVQSIEEITTTLNAGIYAEKRVAKRRWGIGLGILFGKKKYKKDYESVYDFAESGAQRNSTAYPNLSGSFSNYFSQISTDAEVFLIDLPLDLKFYFTPQKKHTFFVGAGISNYLSLVERYRFIAEPTASLIQVSNNNFYKETQYNHFTWEIGTINFLVGFEQAISQRLRIQISPYYKIPIKPITLNEVRVSSFGIRTLLSYN